MIIEDDIKELEETDYWIENFSLYIAHIYLAPAFCVPCTSFFILIDWKLNPNWDFRLVTYSFRILLLSDLRMRLIAARNGDRCRSANGDLEMRRHALLNEFPFCHT